MAAPWRWYPGFMYLGYYVEGDEAVSLDGTKRCKLPDLERDGNIDGAILTILIGSMFASLIFLMAST